MVSLFVGAVVNALAFSGSSYLFSQLRNPSEEIKRHDLAIEKLAHDRNEWYKKRQERIDMINEKLLKEKAAAHKFSDLQNAMIAYNREFKTAPLPELPKEPVLSDYYKPESESHIVYPLIATVAIGYLFNKYW